MLILGGFNAKSPFSGVRKLASELNFYRQFSYPQDTSYSISRVPDQFGVNFVQSKEEPTHEAHRFASRGDRCWYMHIYILEDYRFLPLMPRKRRPKYITIRESSYVV